MLNKFLISYRYPEVESLPISDQLKAFLYDIIRHGSKGASTYDLQAEQHGHISVKINKLSAAGVIIDTVKKDVIDKRGQVRRRVAHRIFIDIDPSVIGCLK